LRFEIYVFGLFDIALGERFGEHPSKFVRSASSRLSLHLISEENVAWWREFSGHASSIRRRLKKDWLNYGLTFSGAARKRSIHDLQGTAAGAFGLVGFGVVASASFGHFNVLIILALALLARVLMASTLYLAWASWLRNRGTAIAAIPAYLPNQRFGMTTRALGAALRDTSPNAARRGEMSKGVALRGLSEGTALRTNS
jgi:hypothetical protein